MTSSKHLASTPAEESDQEPFDPSSESEPIVIDGPYGEMTLEDAARLLQVSPENFMVVPIIMPALPNTAGGVFYDEREQHLTAILSITAVMAVEAIYGYIALRDYGSEKVPRDRKTFVRQQAEELVGTALSKIALSTAEKNSVGLFRDGGWLGPRSGAEAKAYQRSKSALIEALFGLKPPIEDRIESELHVVRAINMALVRAEELATALREYRRAQECGAPITLDLRGRIEGPEVDMIDLMLVAAHGRLNPAELWKKYKFYEIQFEAAIFLGDLMAGVPSVLTPVIALALEDIDGSEVEVSSQTTKGNAMILMLKANMDLVIGRDSFDGLVTSVIRSGRPFEVFPRFFQVE